MCQKESWGAIFATKEAHSTQKGQPPRMHGPGLWRYEQKEQRVTPVPMIGVNCDLWCPGWDGNCKPWFSYGTDVALGAEGNYSGHGSGSSRWHVTMLHQLWRRYRQHQGRLGCYSLKAIQRFSVDKCKIQLSIITILPCVSLRQIISVCFIQVDGEQRWSLRVS